MWQVCSIKSHTVAYRHHDTQAIPFTAQLYSSGGECLRLDVTAQVADLEITLVSPSGAVWRNDNRGVGANPTLPLLKAITDVDGWYTVHVSQTNGGVGNGLLPLRYGRTLFRGSEDE